MKGLIRFYGLSDFWLYDLTDEQRNEVKDRYVEGFFGVGVNGNMNPNIIDQSENANSTQNKCDFLLVMASTVSDIDTKTKLIKMAVREVENGQYDNIDKHFVYMNASKKFKELIKIDSKYYDDQIELLIKDCDIHDEFNLAWPKKHGIVLPNYPSFKELAIAYERTGNFEKAIQISKIALSKKVNESTSFDNRITKLEKKLVK